MNAVEELLDLVNDVTERGEARCYTCKGTVSLQSRIDPHDPPGVSLMASCHGMRSAVKPLALRPMRESFDMLMLADWLLSAAHMPEKIAAYDVDPKAPMVSGEKVFQVDERTSRNTRLGAEMQLEGVRGIAVALNRNANTVTLAVPFAGLR